MHIPMKKLLKSPFVTRPLDLVFSPLTFTASLWFRFCRMLKPQSTPVTEAIFMKMGILPVRDHYYQPLINPGKHLKKSLREDRALPGIDWNVGEQLQLLQQFHYQEELSAIPLEKTESLGFYYNNQSYLGGDAEYLYNIIRLKKPSRIIEIGCGYSTLMIQQALEANRKEQPAYSCIHTCVEPYEMPWLEQMKIEVIRKRVEELPREFFLQLDRDDILFIDSSHMIRPQGDVLFEFLEILPILQPGVLVHVHDIFSPKDYLDEWVYAHVMWNEQYLLEAFLSFNKAFRIIGALNFLKHHHYEAFSEKCPVLASNASLEPGAFWMQRNESVD